MFLTYGLFLAGVIVVIYGLWHGEANFVWAGIVALILAAVLRRMIGRFRLRADKSGVEIEGTLLPPGDAMPESSDDEER